MAFRSGFLICLALGVAAPADAFTLLVEGFDSLPLRPTASPTETPEQSAWTETPPPGWVVDDSGIPSVAFPAIGVEEFEGWSFVDRQWWIATAEDQDRGEFVGGSGVIAVADPDEWDDRGSPRPSLLGFFDAKLTTTATPLGAVAAGEPLSVLFNSSWRPSGIQKATLTARFDDPLQTAQELLRYESSTASQFFRAEATNEDVLLSVPSIPADASNMRLEFRLFDAGNDWWWAIDNLQVFAGDTPPNSDALTLRVDRDSMIVSLVNNTPAPVDLRGYSVVSSAGVFDERAATFLGPDGGWLTATNFDDASNDLSEINLTFDTLAVGQTIPLGPAWAGYFEELGDLAFEYLIEGRGDPVPGNVEFVGNGGVSFDYLDLNYDGVIDAGDWVAFREGYGKRLTGLTEAQRYNRGDLNDDGRHTAADFRAFETAFDAANGAGAFAAMLVPEPSPSVLLLTGLVGPLMNHRLRTHRDRAR